MPEALHHQSRHTCPIGPSMPCFAYPPLRVSERTFNPLCKRNMGQTSSVANSQLTIANHINLLSHTRFSLSRPSSPSSTSPQREQGTCLREPQAARVPSRQPAKDRLHWSPRIGHALARRQDLLHYRRPVCRCPHHGLVRHRYQGHYHGCQWLCHRP